MMSKAPRWPKTLVESNTYRPAQKTGGKEQAATGVPMLSGGKQTGSTLSKTSVRSGRVNSLDDSGSSPTASGSKAGGSLKRGSLSQPGNAGHQAARQASRPARPPRRLCSSRSFSSLHTSSLTAAPFMRSSRSLSRLDQRSAEDVSDAVSSSEVQKGQTTEKKAFSSGQPSSSGEQIRDKDRRHGNNAEKMKTSSSSEPADSSSSLVCTSECYPRCNKVKKQTRDGVYTLCAMTSGMRRNWVQAVLKNVRPNVTPEITRGTEEMTHLKSQKQNSHSAEGVEKDEHLNKFLQQRKSSDCAEETHEQQPEGEQSSAGGSAASPMSSSPQPFSPVSSSSVLPSNSPLQQVNGGASCQCLLVVANTQSGAKKACESCAEGAKSGSFISTTTRSNDDECFDEESAMQRETEEQVKTTIQSEDQKVPFKMSCDCAKVKEQRPCEQQTEQLVKENDLSNLPAEQGLALQQLQKINYDLRCELEAQKRSQEEARETELRRRVELLAQQAQLLVTGDATALAQAHLEQDRRQFLELQVEWERSVASLKSQLRVSEEQRMEAELRLQQLQQELQSFHSLRKEADRLQNQLQEVTTQLHANEEAQAQKEALLQKHLMLLEESQDRERRSLSAGLAQADQHSQDLQGRLDRAEQQVVNLDKTQTWAKEIEKAQQQLQEELASTVSAVQKLQEEREQLERHCQELQNQLSEAEGEVSRLKTDETNCSLERSYERVCEELQLALGKVQQKESETQDMQESYERLLDRKEQELSEVLLKMEVLGNSLEETEVKLNELLKVCTCASSQLNNEPSNPAQQNERLNDSRPVVVDSDSSDAGEHARTHSRSIDSSYPEAVTAGDDSEKFTTAIQILETKLFVTEEKLRDIMQRLDEYQSHATCQDPRLCSQLTESRATAQHLSLLLHSQAKQSQHFAQQTENCCRMLVGRFQVALNIIQACRERLQVGPIDIPDLEKQLTTVVGCLQQGEKDAEKRKQASRNASKAENTILNDETLAAAESNVSGKSKLTHALHLEDNTESIGKCLMNELLVVEHIVSVLQSEEGIAQLCFAPREDEGGVAHRYKSIIAQRIALMTKKSAECNNGVQLNTAIGRVCAEVELIYAASKLLQQYQNTAQVNNQEHQSKGLADISPPELASYEEQVQVEDGGLKGAATAVHKDGSDVKQAEADKEPDWLERLLSRLQRRAKCLRQLIQEIPDVGGVQRGMDEVWENASAADLNWMLQEAKLIYLLDRLHLDLEQEMQQSEFFQDKLRGLCKERDVTSKDEQEMFNHALCQLQEENSLLGEELEHAAQKIISVEAGNQRLLEDMQKIKDFYEKQMKKLEDEFQEEITELQQIHEEELKHLHGFYTKSRVCKEEQTKTCTEAPAFSRIASSAPDQTMMDGKTKVELRNQVVRGDAMIEAYQTDGEKHKASPQDDEGFSAMEDMHRKLIADLQQQHEKEVAALLKEKDQQLQEETAATVTAIVAMRRAHKLELEKSRQFQHIKESADMAQLHAEHEKEIQSMHKELEVLSDQHTQKCLENSRLNQELQDERQALIQCQKENQELKRKQRETDARSESHFLPNGKPHVVPQINDFYEMEVILRAREAEMQFLRQEACALKEELKIARMDKIYAQNKLKALYRKSQDEPCRDVGNLCEDFEFSTWPATREDTATNTGNAAFINETEKSPLTRQIRGVTSKSLKEGLSVQERMKLFESF